MSILRDQESDGTKYFVEPDGKITVKKDHKMLILFYKRIKDYIILMMVILKQKILNV